MPVRRKVGALRAVRRKVGALRERFDIDPTDLSLLGGGGCASLAAKRHS